MAYDLNSVMALVIVEYGNGEYFCALFLVFVHKPQVESAHAHVKQIAILLYYSFGHFVHFDHSPVHFELQLAHLCLTELDLIRHSLQFPFYEKLTLNSSCVEIKTVKIEQLFDSEINSILDCSSSEKENELNE